MRKMIQALGHDNLIIFVRSPVDDIGGFGRHFLHFDYILANKGSIDRGKLYNFFSKGVNYSRMPGLLAYVVLIGSVLESLLAQ
ncbi:hypothetical protein Hanom_Chr10g00932261 [Helianthus anomalus]